MTVDLAATYDAALAAYLANADYAETSDSTKAAAFATACRQLLVIMPKRSAHGGRGAEETELSPELVQGELRRAERWSAQNTRSAGGGRRYFSLENFRE
jgi:hypothetical protein